MLDDLAVIREAEEVDRHGASLVLRVEPDQRVRHDDVAFGDDALDLDAHLRERLDEPDERLSAIRRLRVVLDVLVSEILLHRLAG